jgi:hypothetical protein
LFISVECVRRITWKLTQSSPTLFSFGLMLRLRTLSRDKGVFLSEGKTQASGFVFKLRPFHSSSAQRTPWDSAASLIDCIHHMNTTDGQARSKESC